MKTIPFLAAAVLFAGCASVPKELANARSAYARASTAPAAQLVPAELHVAHLALTEAEEASRNDPRSFQARDLAYIAQRKSQRAEALGVAAADRATKSGADAQFASKQTELIVQGKQDLSDSEGRTADARAELAKLAVIREEERGLVVTLSESVLFRSAESLLLPSARTKLDQLAVALLAVGARNLTIEGHTDSRGSPQENIDLSQRRADAVRDYLVLHNYRSDQIVAHGLGEGHPVANNASPEGRAENRRVEIVIEREAHAARR